jgi:hypothetical protein
LVYRLCGLRRLRGLRGLCGLLPILGSVPLVLGPATKGRSEKERCQAGLQSISYRSLRGWNVGS